MTERWGDSQRDRDALDRWITTEPENCDEPEFDEYDPGDEVDDEGGMSEYRYPHDEDFT